MSKLHSILQDHWAVTGIILIRQCMFGSRDPDWLQHTMNVLVGLFRRYGLAANVAKSQTMTCQPGALRAGMSEETMELKCTGVGDLYRVRLRRQIPCPECGVELTEGSMTAHRRRMHGMDPTVDWSWLPVSQTENQPQVCNVSFLQSTKQYPCTFHGCPESSHTWNGLRSHFNRQYWVDGTRILE